MRTGHHRLLTGHVDIDHALIVRALVRAQVEKLAKSDGSSIEALRRGVRNTLSNLLWNKTHTRPMIIPVVMEV